MDGKQPASSDGAGQFKPGETISPQGVVTPVVPPAPVAPTTPSPTPAAVPAPITPMPPSVPPVASPTTATAPAFEPLPPADNDGSVSWTAGEYVAHQKSSTWYGTLAVGAIIAAFIWWLITKDIISAVVIVAAAGVFGMFAARPPKELLYRLDDQGLTIGQRYYPYDTFRTYAIITQGAFQSVLLTPLKRFATFTTIYYDPKDQDQIIDLLSEHLPLEDRKQDPIDRLMWRIRF